MAEAEIIKEAREAPTTLMQASLATATAQEPHLHGSPPRRPHVQQYASDPSEPALELIDLASGAVVPSSRPDTLQSRLRLPHMWSTYIKLTVDHHTCRDHFGA